MQRLPNYEIQNIVGHGVFGYVFDAIDATNQRRVALKRVQKKGNELSREYQIILELNGCPNIVQMLDFYYSKSDNEELVQNMVFEFMDSNLEALLKEQIKANKLIDEKLLKSYLFQILRGVYQMHQRNICHRDLKPENMLLNTLNEVKICDFGSAKILDCNKINTPYVVTQYYRAPELLLSHQKYSTSIDIWALGCIFFELVTLRILFEGKDEGDQMFKMFEILGTPEIAIVDMLFEFVKNRCNIQPRFLGFKGYSLVSYFSHLKQGQLLYDLVMKMLHFDPTQRITADAALNHQYFINN